MCVGIANVGRRGGGVWLGCRTVSPVDPTPVGVVDGVSIDRDRIRARGWTSFTNRPDATEARLAVSGQVIASASSGPRPDVASAGFPGLNHGFDVSSQPLPPGSYPYCIAAASPGGNARFLTCQTAVLRPAFGSLDSVTTSSTGIQVGGWSADPDAPFEPLGVRITLDRIAPIRNPVDTVIVANRARADVAAAYGFGPDHGFGADLPAAPGTYQVCVKTAQAGVGPEVLLGCRQVVVPQTAPIGSLDQVSSSSASTVRVVGWFADPETSGSIVVTIQVGGVSRTVTANLARPDVAASNPALGPAHGFDQTFTGVPAGVHAVCVSGSGVGAGGSTTLPCGTAVLGSTRVTTTGAPSITGPVGPAPGHPLDKIDRDGGISTTLRDGSVLWLFGDSSEATSSGAFRYFVNNTAAWASATAPARTRDGFTSSATPLRFATPTASFPACPANAPNQAMWPLSAVNVPDGASSRDRVIAYFQNICLGPNLTTASRGVATVEWVYDPAAPPIDQSIAGTVTNQTLFPLNTWGNAAVTSSPGDGFVYVYACPAPPAPGFPDAYGPCRVGRVASDSTASAAAYRFWDASTWQSSEAAATDMLMPPGISGTNNPVATLTVQWEPSLSRYVMAYSQWPGYSDRVALRVATSPAGPWTAPVSIRLPGCDDTVGESGYFCYAGTFQPSFSSGGVVGIGYFDQLVSTGPKRGSYRFGTVPITVSPA